MTVSRQSPMPGRIITPRSSDAVDEDPLFLRLNVCNGQRHRTSQTSSSGPRTSRLEIVFARRHYHHLSSVVHGGLLSATELFQSLRNPSLERTSTPCNVCAVSLYECSTVILRLIFNRYSPEFYSACKLTVVNNGHFKRFCYSLTPLQNCGLKRSGLTFWPIAGLRCNLNQVYLVTFTRCKQTGEEGRRRKRRYCRYSATHGQYITESFGSYYFTAMQTCNNKLYSMYSRLELLERGSAAVSKVETTQHWEQNRAI